MVRRLIEMIFGKRIEKKENIEIYNIEVKDYERINYDKLDLI